MEIRKLEKGTVWTMEQEVFTARIYKPFCELRGDVLNFGYRAPYFLIFGNELFSEEEAADFAEASGLAGIASGRDGSVVFVYPTCEGGWEKAGLEVYTELMANTRIGQYYHDGVLEDVDRFHVRETRSLIRGAKFRIFVYGFGASADYIARNLLDTVQGDYLWGPGEITPTAVSLEGLSFVPTVGRRDIPVISVANSTEIDLELGKRCDNVLVQSGPDYATSYRSFLAQYLRWCGNLVTETVPENSGVVEEWGIETVKTSPDNFGPHRGSAEHEVGYFAWYNEGLLNTGSVPTVMVFHGGGDSSYHIANVSGWWEIARKYGFLLIAVENHVDVAASETIELLEKLKKKYPIDEKRIYATGFSMGGCKTWDLFQEYPEVFAAMAPMDATFDVGHNLYDQPAPRVNREVAVPVFYAGGEITPLPELPFQAPKCYDRIKYLFEVNGAKTPYSVSFEERENWADPIWGISGDRIEKFDDVSRGSVLTINYFTCKDGVERIALASISGQGHECRMHTCEHAWLFMREFTK